MNIGKYYISLIDAIDNLDSQAVRFKKSEFGHPILFEKFESAVSVYVAAITEAGAVLESTLTKMKKVMSWDLKFTSEDLIGPSKSTQTDFIVDSNRTQEGTTKREESETSSIEKSHFVKPLTEKMIDGKPIRAENHQNRVPLTDPAAFSKSFDHVEIHKEQNRSSLSTGEQGLMHEQSQMINASEKKNLDVRGILKPSSNKNVRFPPQMPMYPHDMFLYDRFMNRRFDPFHYSHYALLHDSMMSRDLFNHNPSENLDQHRPSLPKVEPPAQKHKVRFDDGTKFRKNFGQQNLRDNLFASNFDDSDGSNDSVTSGGTPKRYPKRKVKTFRNAFLITDPNYPEYRIEKVCFLESLRTVVLGRTTEKSITIHIFKNNKELENSFDLEGQDIEPIGLECLELTNTSGQLEIHILYYFKEHHKEKDRVTLVYILPHAKKFKPIICCSYILEGSPNYMKVRAKKNLVEFLFLTDRMKLLYNRFSNTNTEWMNQLKTNCIMFGDSKYQSTERKVFVDFSFDQAYDPDLSRASQFVVLEKTGKLELQDNTCHFEVFICQIVTGEGINKIFRLDNKYDLYQLPQPEPPKVVEPPKLTAFTSVQFSSKEDQINVFGLSMFEIEGKKTFAVEGRVLKRTKQDTYTVTSRAMTSFTEDHMDYWLQGKLKPFQMQIKPLNLEEKFTLANIKKLKGANEEQKAETAEIETLRQKVASLKEKKAAIEEKMKPYKKMTPELGKL